MTTRTDYPQGAYRLSDCTCKEGTDWIEPHTCPFGQEIHDSDAKCMCCPSCTQECAHAV